MACNEKCPFCNVPVEDYAIRTPPNDELEAAIDGFIAGGEKTLTISGGEPTLYRKKLVDLVQRARSGGMQFIEVQTNATLIDDDYAREMREAGVTSAFVSLLSHIPSLHDELAGLEGAFPLCLRGIDALIAHGIRVALNPVTASQTQELVPDYVTFVADRFPAITSVSLSAVQPHGRAAKHLELLPDYARLKEVLPEAMRRAKDSQIEMVNPYCGLPLCVGWTEELDHCVEVFEAERGGFDTPGLRNLGNKSQGEPCIRCHLRTRCGGAWHAYWEQLEGSGLSAPKKVAFPWSALLMEGDIRPKTVISSGVLEAHLEKELDNRSDPNLWFWTPSLTRGDARRLLKTRCTDVAIQMNAGTFLKDHETLKAIRQLARDVLEWQPQHRIQIWVGLQAADAHEIRHLEKAAPLAFALGANGVRLLGEAAAIDGIIYGVQESYPNADCKRMEATVEIPQRITTQVT